MIEPIRLTFDVVCPADHAFEVWTDRIGRWWPKDHTVTEEADLSVILEPRPGGRIYERTANGTEHDWGEVTIWDPPERLGYTWHLKRDRSDATEVEIRFVDEGGATTRVEIEHRGWERLGADAEIWRERNGGGWASLLPHYVAAAALPRFVPYQPARRSDAAMLERARAVYEEMDERRSVREFSPDPVPRELIELAIATASTAPSGAHQQPWTFVAVSDPAIKRRIRIAAEEEERLGYEGGRMPQEWRDALAPIGTDWRKPYLETVPWIVVLFEQVHGWFPDGSVRKHYYARESVGIACGLFIAAIHQMGLATLTHTPSPMGFLSSVLERPRNERPFVLLPVGHPAPACVVPDLDRKPLTEVATFVADDLPRS